jgi:hypothetical protein
LLLPYPRCLRYNPRTIVGAGERRRYFPAMIAVENDLELARPADLPRSRRHPAQTLAKTEDCLWPLGDAAIRLAPADEELGLAEGIEDALSAMAWFGTPTWALGAVERLGLVAIPERVKRIIVYAIAAPPLPPCSKKLGRISQPMDANWCSASRNGTRTGMMLGVSAGPPRRPERRGPSG